MDSDVESDHARHTQADRDSRQLIAATGISSASREHAPSWMNPTQSHYAPAQLSRRSVQAWYRVPSSTPRCCHGVGLEVLFRDSLVRQTAVPWRPTHESRP